MLSASGEQHVFEPGVDEQPVSAVGEDEQHTFRLDVVLEHERGLSMGGSGASIFVLSRLTVERAFFALANVCSDTEDSSVACGIQQEGSPNLSISVQRHSARSRAAFHCARECFIPKRGVDRASPMGLSAIWAVEACAMALKHFSAHYQCQLFERRRRLRGYHHSMEQWKSDCGEHGTQDVRKAATVVQSPWKICLVLVSATIVDLLHRPELYGLPW